MTTSRRRVCVYAGSSDAISDRWRVAARELGRAIAARDMDLVFGGGRVGLMGEIADAALAAGTRVYGVIPRKLQDLEVGHDGCTELFVVQGMHSRKALMASLSDAFVALPGGWGTLEELFEMTTWLQIGYHDKPIGVLNVGGYYDKLLSFLDHVSDEGFIRPGQRELLRCAAEPGALLDQLLG